MTRNENQASGCVFCGGLPVRKSCEHILPKWLLSFTGNPKRQANFGLPWEPRLYSFDQFQFPACDTCNQAYASLEGTAKGIVSTLLVNGPLDQGQCVRLLDWCDKIRIGLWLAELQLHGNAFNIAPNFRISTRVGMSDRILFIGTAARKSSGLNFAMFGDPVFNHSPSVVTLRINHLCFVSFAHHGTVGPSVGFPYVSLEESAWNGGAKRRASVYYPRRKTRRPALPTHSRKMSILAQAVVPPDARRSQVDDAGAYGGSRSPVFTHRFGMMQPVAHGVRATLPKYTHIAVPELMRTALTVHGRLRRFVARSMPRLMDENPYRDMWKWVSRAGENWVC